MFCPDLKCLHVYWPASVVVTFFITREHFSVTLSLLPELMSLWICPYSKSVVVCRKELKSQVVLPQLSSVTFAQVKLTSAPSLKERVNGPGTAAEIPRQKQYSYRVRNCIALQTPPPRIDNKNASVPVIWSTLVRKKKYESIWIQPSFFLSVSWSLSSLPKELYSVDFLWLVSCRLLIVNFFFPLMSVALLITYELLSSIVAVCTSHGADSDISLAAGETQWL